MLYYILYWPSYCPVLGQVLKAMISQKLTGLSSVDHYNNHDSTCMWRDQQHPNPVVILGLIYTACLSIQVITEGRQNHDGRYSHGRTTFSSKNNFNHSFSSTMVHHTSSFRLQTSCDLSVSICTQSSSIPNISLNKEYSKETHYQ